MRTAEELLTRRGWVEESGPLETPCWILNGYRQPNKYSKIYFRGRHDSGHRVAYVAWHSEIPEGLLVRHRCDVKPCINPEHLLLGTASDNWHDANERGLLRIAHGETLPHSKLKSHQIPEILRLRNEEGWTLERIAERYGVNRSTIGYVTRGDTWASL